MDINSAVEVALYEYASISSAPSGFSMSKSHNIKSRNMKRALATAAILTGAAFTAPGMVRHAATNIKKSSNDPKVQDRAQRAHDFATKYDPDRVMRTLIGNNKQAMYMYNAACSAGRALRNASCGIVISKIANATIDGLGLAPEPTEQLRNTTFDQLAKSGIPVK